MEKKVVVGSSRINRPFCRFKYYLFFRKTTKSNKSDGCDFVARAPGPSERFPQTEIIRELLRVIYVSYIDINKKRRRLDLVTHSVVIRGPC